MAFATWRLCLHPVTRRRRTIVIVCTRSEWVPVTKLATSQSETAAGAMSRVLVVNDNPFPVVKRIRVYIVLDIRITRNCESPGSATWSSPRWRRLSQFR
eukprot:4085360-Prymnesium_polylepis.1